MRGDSRRSQKGQLANPDDLRVRSRGSKHGPAASVQEDRPETSLLTLSAVSALQVRVLFRRPCLVQIHHGRCIMATSLYYVVALMHTHSNIVNVHIYLFGQNGFLSFLIWPF